jgi:polysaccharide biosynthesis transport protein
MTTANQSFLPVPVSTGAIQRAPAPAPRARTQPAADAGLDWSRITAALLRFKWLIIPMVILGAVVGRVAARFVPAQYVASATIVIDQGDRRNADPTAPFRTGQAFSPEAWVSLLRTATVLDTVVTQRHIYLVRQTPMDSGMINSFGLAEHFAPGGYRLSVDRDGRSYSLATANGEVLERGTTGSAIGTRLGFKWTPPAGSFAPGTTYVFSVRSPRDAAIGLGNALKPQIDAEGTILKLDYTSQSPQAAAAVLNAIADRFVVVSADLKRQGVVTRAQILGDQLGAAQKALAAAEKALENYRVETVTLPRTSAGRAGLGTDDRGPTNPAVDSYLDMASQLDQTQKDRLAVQRVIAAASDSGLSITELQLLKPVTQVPELMHALDDLARKRTDLQMALLRHTDLMPDVQRLRGDVSNLERNTIPVLVQRIVDDLQTRESDLRSRITAKREDLKDIPPRLLEDARLERNRSLAEYLYNTLQQKYTEAQLAAISSLSDVRVLDRAMPPEYPEKDTATRLLLMAILGGLGLGCAGAVLLDRLDPKFRYPEQVSKEMGLAILGAIPHVRLNSRSGKAAQESAVFLEALRGIRMNLAYAYGSAGPLVFTLSSPGGSDGKSFLAANLARVFAESGRRVLLIDADLRRGRLHHRCGLQRRPGLTDFLRGDAPLERILQHTKFPDFDLITSGTRVHEAPELLGTPAMAQLLGELKLRYDVVICDSPPLAAGVDPFILSALSGSLLLVLRTGVSLRDVAEAKLEVLSRMPVRLLGAVLNDVPTTSAYQYYSNYLPGYDTSDEAGGPAPQAIIA